MLQHTTTPVTSSRVAAQRVGAARIARRIRPVRVEASLRVEDVSLEPSTTGRRGLLALTAGALVSMVASPVQLPAHAKTCAAETETEDEDTACRRDLLSRDVVGDQTATYNQASSRGNFTAVQGVPVANLDSEYARATLKLREDLISYANMDAADYKNRLPLIKTIKTEGSDWVSKYARGGSARTDSARRMYIAVDAVIGHLASNGYAPMPRPKLKAVLANVDQAKAFLEEGK